MSFAWLYSPLCTGAWRRALVALCLLRRARCAAAVAARRARRRGPTARARAGARRTRSSTARARHPLARRDVDRPRRHRRPGLHQGPSAGWPTCSCRGCRRRLPGARFRSMPASPGPLAAGDRRRPGRPAAGGLHQQRDAVRGRRRRSALQSAERARALVAGAANPSLSIINFGKAYLAFTATAGAGGDDVRAAYYYQGQWALESDPAGRHPADDAGRRHRTPGGGRRRRRRRDRRLGRGGPHLHAPGDRAPRRAPSSSRPIPPRSAGGHEIVGQPSRRSPPAATRLTPSVAFHERSLPAAARQSRVLMNRLHGSTYDGVARRDGPPPGRRGRRPAPGRGHRVRRRVRHLRDTARPTTVRHARSAAPRPRADRSASTPCPTAARPTPYPPPPASSRC